MRNAAYEGDLVMLHLLGRDITDPLVRARAARNANHIGSAARPALRSSRRELEDIAITSARMTRARFANINEMGKVLTAGNAEDRILAAMTITSAVGYTLIFGQYMNNLIGAGEFEWDPTEGGFGTITTAGGRVIDMVPQDSVVRAFARSIDEIKNGDPEAAAQAWAKVYLGSASIVGRIPPALAGFGFEPGAGFRFGDLTRTGTILNLAPLPPVLNRTLAEGWDAMGTALDSVGIGNFEESAFGERQRLLEGEGVETEDLSTSQQFAQIEQRFGPEVVDLLEEREIEELRELAGRGDRTAQARLLSFDLRAELTRIAADSGSRAEYRQRRKNAIQQYIGAQATFDDVFRGFGESDDPIKRAAGQRYALRDQAVIGSELDFDVLDELEAEFDAGLAPGVRSQVLSLINAIDPREHPWEQELDLLNQQVGAAGWWDLKDDVWERVGFRAATGFATERDAADEFITRITAQAIAAGLTPGRASEEAREEWQKSDLKASFNEAVSLAREQWVTEDPGRAELADQMIQWGIWDNVTEDVEDYLDLVLAA